MRSKFIKFAAISLALFLCLSFNVMIASAATLDELTNGNVTEDPVQNYNSGEESADFAGWLKGYTPVTQENMQQASYAASPIVNFFGICSGFVMMCVSGGIFLVTAVDFAYICIPPLRQFLNPQYGTAGMQQTGGSPMGGMGGMGGYGMRGMGMGGMMGGMAGGQQAGGQIPERGLRRRYVSDEAVYCVNLMLQTIQPQMQQAGGSPMGGMGGFGMGGMMGGAMGGAQQQQAEPITLKSALLEYTKKRVFFLIIFGFASVVLMSSIFTGCGINLGELLFKIMNKVNGQITSVNI